MDCPFVYSFVAHRVVLHKLICMPEAPKLKHYLIVFVTVAILIALSWLIYKLFGWPEK